MNLLQGLFVTSGISPFVVLVRTNFSASLHTGTQNHFQASSALHSTKVLASVTRSSYLLAVFPSRFFTVCKLLAISDCGLLCILINTLKDSFYRKCTQSGDRIFTFLVVMPSREFSSLPAVSCFQAPTTLLFSNYAVLFRYRVG